MASLTYHSIFDFKNGFWKQELHPNASKTFWAPRLDVLLINQLGFLGRGRNSIFFQFFFISFMACKNSVHDEDFPPISNKQIQKQQKISKKQYWYLKCEKIPDCTAICLGPFVFVQKKSTFILVGDHFPQNSDVCKQISSFTIVLEDKMVLKNSISNQISLQNRLAQLSFAHLFSFMPNSGPHLFPGNSIVSLVLFQIRFLARPASHNPQILGSFCLFDQAEQVLSQRVQIIRYDAAMHLD